MCERYYEVRSGGNVVEELWLGEGRISHVFYNYPELRSKTCIRASARKKRNAPALELAKAGDLMSAGVEEAGREAGRVAADGPAADVAECHSGFPASFGLIEAFAAIVALGGADVVAKVLVELFNSVGQAVDFAVERLDVSAQSFELGLECLGGSPGGVILGFGLPDGSYNAVVLTGIPVVLESPGGIVMSFGGIFVGLDRVVELAGQVFELLTLCFEEVNLAVG